VSELIGTLNAEQQLSGTLNPEQQMGGFLAYAGDKAPYIGANGNWYVYDRTASAYVDSGYASGPSTAIAMHNTDEAAHADIREKISQLVDPSGKIEQAVMPNGFSEYFVPGKNLFDKTAVTAGYYVLSISGALGANATYCASDYIPIKPNTAYVRSYINQLAFYDASKAYISGLTALAAASFTTPANARYVRVTVLSSGLNTYQFEKGITSTTYEAFASGFVVPAQYKTVQSVMSKIVFSDIPKKIKLIGDSITHGEGGTGFAQDGAAIMTLSSVTWNINTSGHCWANDLKAYLEEKHNCTVLNYGCTGSDSGTIVAGLNQLIDGTEHIVICMIGTNDRHQNTKAEFRSNLLAINQYCNSRGIDVIFMSSIPATVASDSNVVNVYHMEDVDHVIMSVSAELNQEYISVYKMFLEYCQNRNIAIDSLLSGGLHPNDAGYDVMFYLICSALGFGVKRDGATW
jgi:lysophospholipase L1-like esterase